MKSKTSTALLAIFLGGFGIHRFYLGQTLLGILYLLFSWTFIPAFIGLIDFVVFLVMDEEKFNAKYNSGIQSNPQSVQPGLRTEQASIQLGKVVAIGIAAVIAMAFIGYMISGGIDDQVQRDLDNISSSVARDAEKQYEIAVKNGEHMDAYLQAGLVAAAYLQAKDEGNYKKWKKIEKEAGKKVGIY